MFVAPITELDAVNEILNAGGSSPIDTLVDMTDLDAINAYTLLQNTSRQFQSRGWTFNTIENYRLIPDKYTHEITYNDNILYIKGSGNERLVKKEGKVFNVDTQASIFTKPLSVTIIYLVPFEELPEQARTYVLARASQLFCVRFVGDELIIKQQLSLAQEAWSYFQEYDLDTNNYTMTTHVDITKLTQR